MHFTRRNERRRIGRQVTRQKRCDQHTVLIDNAADLFGEIVATNHKDEFHVVFVDKLLDACERKLGLKFCVERHEVDHIAPHADLDAACGVDAIPPDQAAIKTRLCP